MMTSQTIRENLEQNGRRTHTRGRLQSGRRDVDDLARAHGAALYGWALHLTGDRSDACDLVQDTYERALRDVVTDVSPDKARSWLFVIMRNLYLDRWRARQRRALVHLDIDGLDRIPAPEPEEAPAWSELGADHVRRCVSGLSGRLRHVYELHALEGLSYAEISSRLDLPAGTIGTRLFRARQKLREALEASLAA